MSRVIAGFATSHTPLLALETGEWEARAVNDRKNPHLYDTAGVHRSYAEIEESVGGRYAPLAVASRWNEQYASAQRDLDRLAAALDGRPDAWLVVGDDEGKNSRNRELPGRLGVLR